MSTSRPTVVLIPDAWHGVEYFDEYRRHLEKLGFPSLAVPLPSIGANPPHPNIYGDVADIRDALLSLIIMGKEVVLAMHSYGGLPGSEAINGLSKTERMEQGLPGGIITLLYIAAFLLPLDRSIENFERMFWPSTPCWERLDAEGRAHITDGRAAFYHDLEENEALKWVSRLKSSSINCFSSQAKHTPFKIINTVYVVCKKDRVLMPNRQWNMINYARLTKWVSVDTGHTPFLVVPALLAEITRAAAGETVILNEGSIVQKGGIGYAFDKLRISEE